jgi:hypothetical protein
MMIPSERSTSLRRDTKPKLVKPMPHKVAGLQGISALSGFSGHSNM